MKLSHAKLTSLLTQIPSTFDIEFEPVHSDVMDLAPSKRDIKVVMDEELMLATITIVAIPDLESNYVAVYHSMDKWASDSVYEFHELMGDLIHSKDNEGVDTEEAIHQLVDFIESIIIDDLYYEILYADNEKCSTAGFAQWLLINY